MLQAFDSAGLLTGRFTYHTDHLGSVRFMTDQAGNIANEYDYDSYGRVTGEVETVEQPFGFTGRDYDEAVNLYQYRARAYDPETGRFIQEDPKGFAGGDLNLYRYVLNNPNNSVDPSGTTAIESGTLNKIAALGLLGAAGGYAILKSSDLENKEAIEDSFKKPVIALSAIARGIACNFSIVSEALNASISGHEITGIDGCGVTLTNRSKPADTPIEPLFSLPRFAPLTCPPPRKDELQSRKNTACNRKRSCKKLNPDKDADLIQRNLVRNKECLRARISVMNVCYGGGDFKHGYEAIKVEKHVTDCENLIK